MQVTVRVTARSRRPGIVQQGDGSLHVRVTAPAEGGRANAAVIAALARHFGVPKQAVAIVRGHTNRQKVVEIAREGVTMRNKPWRVVAIVAMAGWLVAGQALAATTKDKEGLLALGAKAPGFALQDVVTLREWSLKDWADKEVLVVMFICRHCPYVQRVKGGLAQLGRDYADKDVGIAAISSNDPKAIPEDSPGKLKGMALEEGFVFPLLFDETQKVAAAYTALCTPDIFVFDAQRRLVYRGQFDDARPGNRSPVTGQDVRAAIEAVLAGQPVSSNQRPSVGCGIKWQPGREPAYTRR
ncbi:MAG: DUF167 domain-containing protein [Candidatus Omnitrophica bacterium]|nr:DUF167 domain-containing protein [Candidatus Omnitrophota bacterium]